MKNFNQVLDFLELQQQEDKLNTNQLHLIIQTLCTFLDKEQMQEVENLFNQFNITTFNCFPVPFINNIKIWLKIIFTIH